MLHRRLALAALMLAGTSCASGVTWVRPEATLEENRADYAACEEETSRVLQAEFAYERGIAGESIPSGPGANPVPMFPAIGSIARSRPDDIWLRDDIDSGRVRADLRRQELLRACLTSLGFRAERDEDAQR